MTVARRVSLELIVSTIVGAFLYRLLNGTIGWLANINPLLLALALCFVLLARFVFLRRRSQAPHATTPR
jgi:hypothetical protein